MFYKRDILPALEKELVKKEITVITGMRQVGKTTLLRYLYGQIDSTNKAMLDIGNPLQRNVFEEENFDAIWNNLKEFGVVKNKKAYLFLDEIQNLPSISQAVKYLYDHYNVKFVLAGSSSYYLKNLFPESLAGRKIVFEIFPLTFGEFLRFNGIEKKTGKKNRTRYELYRPFYLEYLEYGGFPSVVLEKDVQRKKLLLQEVFTSYFEIDAKNLSNFGDMARLRSLILLLAGRVGSKIEVAKLSSELSSSRETVYNYISFLEKTYFIALVPKFSKSIDRQAAGSKKLYFCDGGITNMLGRVSEGQLFEQSVFQDLRAGHILNYYSNRSGSEIDFILDGRIGLEVKLSATGRDISNLEKKAEKLKLKEKYIVSLQYSNEKKVVLATDL
ncbi:MAG: ATP-binding protein [bacterium]|nr:ATP-binding protein [bacterium]